MTEQEILVYLKNADHVLPSQHRVVAQNFATLADYISRQPGSPARAKAMQRLFAAFQGMAELFGRAPVPVQPFAQPAQQRPPSAPAPRTQPPPPPQRPAPPQQPQQRQPRPRPPGR